MLCQGLWVDVADQVIEMCSTALHEKLWRYGRSNSSYFWTRWCCRASLSTWSILLISVNWVCMSSVWHLFADLWQTPRQLIVFQDTSSDGRPLTQLLRCVLSVVTFRHSFHAPGRKNTQKGNALCVHQRRNAERRPTGARNVKRLYVLFRVLQIFTIDQHTIQLPVILTLIVSVTCLIAQTCLRFMCRIEAM